MATYDERRRDPRWQRKRLEIYERDGFACVDCGTKTENLQIDHAWYEPRHAPWEYPDSCFFTRCDSCHARIGEERIRLLKLLATLPLLSLSSLVEALHSLAFALTPASPRSAVEAKSIANSALIVQPTTDELQALVEREREKRGISLGKDVPTKLGTVLANEGRDVR